MKRFLAILYLGFHFLLHLLSRLLPWRQKGEIKFLEYYQGDRIVPLDTMEKQLLFSAARCLRCGLCDLVASKVFLENPVLRIRPSSWASSCVRSTLEYPYLFLPSELGDVAKACEEVCPQKIPLQKVFKFMTMK